MGYISLIQLLTYPVLVEHTVSEAKNFSKKVEIKMEIEIKHEQPEIGIGN